MYWLGNHLFCIKLSYILFSKQLYKYKILENAPLQLLLNYYTIIGGITLQ